MKTTVTRDSLRQHWHYNSLKYLVMIVAISVAWNLIYTTTRYRPPQDKCCDFFVSSSTGNQEALNAYLETVRVNDLPEMEQMTSAFLTTDEYYAAAQIMTYFAAGEGTVYLLPATTFQNYAAGDYFVPLDGYTDLIAAAEAAGIPIDKGWRTLSETGERHLYGIPATMMTNLNYFGVNPQDMYLCVPGAHGNNDVAAQFMCILIRDMIPAENAPAGSEVPAA